MPATPYPTAPGLRRVGVTPGLKLGIVPAVPVSTWPAAQPQVPIAVDERAPKQLPARQFKPSNPVSSSIFGGPVTVGDPETTTVTISAYTDKVEPVVPAMGPEEGWVDIFGEVHGRPVPAHARARMGRGTFNVPLPMNGFGDDPKPMPTATKVALGVAAVGVVGGALWYLSKKK